MASNGDEKPATNGSAPEIDGAIGLKNCSVARSAAVNDGERHRAAAGRPRGSESGLMNFKILVVVASLLASVAAAPSFRLSEVDSPAAQVLEQLVFVT